MNNALLDVVSNLLPILEYLRDRGIYEVYIKYHHGAEITILSNLFKEMFGDVARDEDGYARATYNGISFKAYMPPEDA